MKNLIKRLISSIVFGLIRCLGRSSVGRFTLDEVVNHLFGSTSLVQNQELSLKFTVPNSLNYMRAETFFTKEPETIEWIDSLPDHSVLWDIGANVGLYTCYAAATKNCTVYAFEPSVFNLELLARNIYVNKLSDRAVIVPLPLSDILSINKLNMTSTQLGGALSTFAKDYGDDGKTLEKVFDFNTVGISIEDAVNLLKLPTPDHIKMDVDGIEHLILGGGEITLRQVKSVLIEVNDDFAHQAKEVEKILLRAGLSLTQKRQADLISESERFGNTYNQIWRRAGKV